ncbi:Serine/Threonine kinase domain protein (macronuclear) [Tetrahymena thermophila SB210]|uniref:Serine/Threonine kinase domain protein n=1 Tax=Tetrahymena thermophila (strain SB210) TaxID=312017 RepID=I7MDF4_TETTS|nr:Serine/Threonine kinase domain protein [Tetrahymena thermophila SB210]EAR87484.2 Serine/Threonine kinase domain protein [Tetrahymena thermophila SB210]|eukprot:XP_001007729.2 Serine/Threonine kinase domain protein [Tetrahymena thermophila SB210]
MFRKQDFKKLDLLGSGKKHTKIFKVQHLQTGKIYALKEIEAKTLDKLNEYKEEAVQLSKVQNCNNVIKFHGYYFSETQYQTFRLGIITEFMDHNTNLEMIYRKRKKLGIQWKESELVTIMFSLISVCSLLQQKGICHRDIKPANIFIMENGEVKLIDFGESKDYFYDPEDESKNTYTMATIRGTPQYLSPILWKAHVVDGNSRYVEHNIYKSDVFSSGLLIYQLAAIEEVTGFNNKTPQTDGEQLIKQALIELEKKYSNQFVNIIALMLIFEESGRPSFVEIEQLFIEHENQARETANLKEPKKRKLNEYIRMYNQQFNTLLKAQPIGSQSVSKSTQLISQQQSNNLSKQSNKENQNINGDSNTNGNPTSTKSAINKENYGQFYKESTLILNENCYWFEFGGSSIGKFSIHKQKWKIAQNPDKTNFPYHFSTIYIPEQKGYFLLGGQSNINFRTFVNGKMAISKNPMPVIKNFFPAVYYSHRVYTFGGYDSNLKVQLSSCECYNIQAEKWQSIGDLIIPRSQSAGCRINDNEILIFGGYNKEKGTLDSIERYLINENKFEVTNIKLPIPLRRFMVVRVSNNNALILGGLTKFSKESQKVFKLEYDKKEIIELESLEKGGVIENEILVDNEDYMHIFLEHANGTSPHSHIKYYYDPKATRYVTKQE